MENVVKTYNFIEMIKRTISYYLEIYLMEMVRFKEANH